MKTKLITIAIFVIVSVSNTMQVQASSAKDTLVKRIALQQQADEQKILSMWMNNKRGKAFELLLANYVAREVRFRAMSGKINSGTLLSSINIDNSNEIKDPLDLGRLLILEYFIRKGVNLKEKHFVKGSYFIALNLNFTDR